MKDREAEPGNLSGGGSLIFGTGETLTEQPVSAGGQSLEDSRTAHLHHIPATGNGSSPNPPELVGQTVDGTVTGITHFGAFVNLEAGQTGLIHISEIAYEYVRDVREHVKLNETVRVKVLQVNPANGKYDLSLKQTREGPVAAAVAPKSRRNLRDKVLAESGDPVFEEKLTKFLKTSDERLQDVKRNIEAKRAGRFK